MEKKLSGVHILIIIIIIIIVLYLVYFIVSCWSRKKYPYEYMTAYQNHALNANSKQCDNNGYNGGSIGGKTPYTLYNFYDPKCGFAQKFLPVWHQIVRKLNGVRNLSVHTVDLSNPQNEKLAFYYGVTASPTVILVTPKKNIQYTGDRNLQDVLNFVMSNLK